MARHGPGHWEHSHREEHQVRRRHSRWPLLRELADTFDHDPPFDEPWTTPHVQTASDEEEEEEEQDLDDEDSEAGQAER